VRTGQTDDDLMAAFRAGDRRAFDELFERYRQPVWAFFRRRVVDPSRAEELAQDVFVALLNAAHRYEPRGAFRSYLFGVAFRTMGAARREARNHEALAVDAGGQTTSTSDPAAALWVRDALAALDEPDREVLMLREYEQLSYDEIAVVINVSVNTVRMRLFRARAALKAALDGRGQKRRA